MASKSSTILFIIINFANNDFIVGVCSVENPSFES